MEKILTVEEIKKMTENDPKYRFLKENEHLGNNIILLGLGGSYAYGTMTDTSDIDVRGVALNSCEEILTNRNFEQVTDTNTDTVIYSFNKMINLLSNCNPNVIEILGLRSDQYIYISPMGQMLIDNRHLFLSKNAVHTFGGYAYSQLRRLDNKSARYLNQPDQEQHILNSIQNAKYSFPSKYFDFDEDSISLYIDEAVNPEVNSEIFMDITMHHYPLRDYKAMWEEMNNIVKEYAKIGQRNKNAIEHKKIAKHMMHLIRLYMMCIDILEKEEIITCRENEHDLLMSIRNGEWMEEDGTTPKPKFFDLVDEYKNKMDVALQKSKLPNKPDYNKINKLMIEINRRVILEDR